MTALPSSAGSQPMAPERTKGPKLELSGRTLAAIGGGVVTLAVSLILSSAQCAGSRAVEATVASFASAASVNELRAAVKEQHYRDSMQVDRRLERIEMRQANTDSLVRCIRATQLKRPVCE